MTEATHQHTDPAPPRWRTTRSGSWFFLVAGCCLLPVLATLMLLAFWLLDQRTPMANIQGHVVGGDRNDPQIVYIERTGTKLRSCDGFSHRWLVDKHGFLFELRDDHIPYPEAPSNKPEKWIFRVEVPPAMRGELIYKTIFYFTCNPIQRLFPIEIDVPDIHFEFPPKNSWPQDGMLMPDDLGNVR
jgi:hypothetical protein